jgi:hypothetical protein
MRFAEMTRIAIPALVVMIAVSAFVAVAGWNESGEPRLVITLTERELQLPVRAAAPGDDPGVKLRVAYEQRDEPLDSRNWLTESRLREIGFALHVPAGSPEALDTYDHVPARVAWVVFEYDGPQWREIARRRALRAPGPVPAVDEAMWSRLVPVDAGLEFDALRRRYANGHLIVRAVIGLTYVKSDLGGPLIRGRLHDVVPRTVAVPHEFRPLFDGLREPGRAAIEPRYEVDLAVGTLGLPYIRAVRLR